MLRPWHYSLVLDKNSPSSIHQQLTEHFRSMIEGGSWLGGSALPSSRDIAQRLGINRKTVSRVYEELAAQGLIYTQPKRGTFVSENPHHILLAPQSAANASSITNTVASSIQQLIQKACIYHFRRVALHIHKLRPQDYDVTGLFDLKHMLANLLAHERRYLVSPEHIACGHWPALQTALIHSLNLGQGYLLIDHTVSPVLELRLRRQGVAVLRLPEMNVGQVRVFIEQIEKYCINYPVAAIWCDSASLIQQQQAEAEQALLLQKLSDYHLLLIDDQRHRLPDLQDDIPLSTKYAKSYLLGSLYGNHCDMFNLTYVASNLGFSEDFLNELNEEHQPALLNMLAQSELIKRGEYKKLLSTIQRLLP
ncbi:GntR family transcriptional regulator [Methylophilus sp.]|uniref:GntR family transcriptional regulator n=1 Tax=Methylophilus sp. TaxID=29541 RepID=UPI00257A3418|nr:GntR family transcriptional regulator [Methylophilus sp.]